MTAKETIELVVKKLEFIEDDLEVYGNDLPGSLKHLLTEAVNLLKDMIP